ncbi:MAG: tetratricopeptide repeat protein [Candidatus Omnitrophota bacterium]
MRKKVEIVIILIVSAILIYVLYIKQAPHYYNRGIEYYDQGLFDKALFYFNKSLDINPDEAVAHYMLANTYIAKSMFNNAIKECKDAIRVDPGFIQAHLALARMYRNDQKYDQALVQLKQAESFAKGNQELKSLLDEVNFEYAVNCLKQGIDLLIKQNKQESLGLLKKAIKLKPDLLYAHYGLAYFYFAQQDYDQAQKQLKEAINLDSKFWLAHKLLGDTYFQKGLFEEAIFEYTSTLAFNYNDAKVYNDLGLALVQLGRYGEAARYLEKAVELDSDNLNIQYSLASVYRDMKAPDKAIAEYEKIIRFRPDFPHIYIDLGDIYLNKKKERLAQEMYKREIEYAQKALLGNPNDPFILNNLAYALNGIGKIDQAKEIIGKVLAKEPNYGKAYITLSQIYGKMGKYNEAIDALNKSKESYATVNFLDRDIDRLREELQLHKEVLFDIDTIYLKNGRMIKGRIQNEDNEKIVIEIRIGSTLGYLTFYRNVIERIVKEK